MFATQASYIAGFFDGDGSVHFQFVRQREYRFGYYIRASASFSQSTSARSGLVQIQSWLGGGYLRDRGTGMSDLVLTSRPRLLSLFEETQPYVVFKRRHVQEALRILPLIRPRMAPEEFLDVVRTADAFSALNYSKTKRTSAVDVERHLRSMGMLAPVTTSLLAQQGDGECHNTPAPGNRVKV